MIIKNGLYSRAEVDAAMPVCIGTINGFPVVDCFRFVYFGFTPGPQLVDYRELYAFRHADTANFRRCFLRSTQLTTPAR